MSQQKNKKPPASSAKKQLIYLVDDEALLLDLAELALESEGFIIQKFQDPAVALRTFLKAKEKPVLLISDYAMGKMNGLELIERCKEAAPTLKTILVSGTAGAEIIMNSPVAIDRFMGKPYQASNLSELVRRVLE